MNIKNKYGQVTIYIILGLILLIGLGFLNYLRNGINKEKVEEISEIPFEVNSIKTYIQNCIQITGKDALFYVGKQGGYYELKKPYLIDDNFNLPYYFYNNLDFSPSIKDIEKEISKYLNNKLPFCINYFKDFREQGYDINGNLINNSIIITENSLKIKSDYPLSIYKDKTYLTYNEFSNDVPIRLNLIYNISKSIVDRIAKDDNICLSCLLEYGIKNNLSIEIYEISNSTFIFYIKDNQSILEGDPFTFRFAVKGKEERTTIIEPTALNILPIPNQIAEAGYLFTYKLLIEGKENVTFTDYTPLFDIDSRNGLINFTPTLEQIGQHLVIVEAKNAYGNKDTELFSLNITFFNNPPVIDYIGFLTARVNKPFYYKVNAHDIDNQTIFFLDNADLFNISLSSGIINFIPTNNDLGSYKVNITVIDSKGGKDTEELNLIIVGE